MLRPDPYGRPQTSPEEAAPSAGVRVCLSEQVLDPAPGPPEDLSDLTRGQGLREVEALRALTQPVSAANINDMNGGPVPGLPSSASAATMR